MNLTLKVKSKLEKREAIQQKLNTSTEENKPAKTAEGHLSASFESIRWHGILTS